MDLFTVAEVAERLRVSATCVYQLIEKGSLACHRIGIGRGTIRVAESDLLRFLEGCRDSRSEKNDRSSRPAIKLRHLQQ